MMTLDIQVNLAESYKVHDIYIVSYADDNIPYMTAYNVDDLITSLEQASNSLFE